MTREKAPHWNPDQYAASRARFVQSGASDTELHDHDWAEEEAAQAYADYAVS